MKKILRILLFCVLCISFIFTDGCSAEKKEGIFEQNTKGYYFISQEIQPIEENPITLPAEISPELGLHFLDVQRPNMDEIHNSDDVVNALLGSANQAVNIEGKDLVDYIYIETGEQPLNKSISDKDGYFRALIQNDSNDLENSEFMWVDIYLDAINYFVPKEEGNKECSNCAVLIKYRNSGINGGHNIGFSISNVFVNLHIDNSGRLEVWSNDEQNQTEYSIGDTRGEYAGSLMQLDNKWYYALVAMDEHLGYRFITWQENEPSNNAFYACDLSAVYSRDDEISGSNIWANISFNSSANEASLDIDSIAVYEFENFNDIDTGDQADPLDYEYTNEQEKYDLAVKLFKAEDYYNAYMLFNELDGYDTEDYLTECERSLKTIEIQNPHAAGKIRKALKENGMPIYEYLYVYQAENLESLDLSECLIEDLGFISSFSNLRYLNLDNNAISDLTPLKDLILLERLSLGKNHISDITPLNDLANLQVLALNSNLLADVSSLNNMPSLVAIDLSTNDIVTIADLSNLVNLESVDLSYNLISSVSALENLHIKELNIMNTDIGDLNAIANFTELESLKAGFRYIWKGDERYLLTNKYVLEDHFFNGLSGLEALVGHNNLKSLYLGTINGGLNLLATLTNLETLVFHQYSGAEDPNVLASLVNLKELVLDSGGIGFYDVSFLANLSKLEKLSIEMFCYVEDLSVISGLTNLQELRMYKYGEDLSFLTGLKNLRLLELKNWHTVNDYSPLLALENLEYLVLEGGEEGIAVNDLSIISQLENLKFLNIDSAQINNIKDVGQLGNLECFFMRNTEIVGESNPDFFDRSLLDGLDHLKLADVGFKAVDGWGYELGDPEFIELIEEPVDKGIDEPEYDYYWINNMDDVNNLNDYVGDQNQVIDGDFSVNGESVKLTIPKYVRNLYIFSYSGEPVKLELDCDGHEGLERLVIGHIDVSKDDPDGFGHGNFIIENLDGLSTCTNLKEIYINSSKIEDISALASLDKLEILELPGNHIHNVGALAIYKD
ncbi:MAG: leucine-rich repeat domain-containing protein [Chloroflexi bacterium]|nr:leucine-rich repeat domain-containing protein [Chloroflexota bacterium]